MIHAGIDLEQFIVDPYGSGIQRVLQQLAVHWPHEECAADFVVPHGQDFLILTPEQASSLIGLAFSRQGQGDLRGVIDEAVGRLADEVPLVDQGRLLALYDRWLLPEVSYLPSVLERFKLFALSMPVAMIGYDTLPMTDPANYRFTPGTAANVSEYFRLLARADTVVCISEFARESILDRLRRDRSLPISVAHPGGDHVPVADDRALGTTASRPMRMLRVGTLEARKRPAEIVMGFQRARELGLEAELIFVGKPSASDFSINHLIRDAVDSDLGVTWIQDAPDDQVRDLMQDADLFLSLGIEGFGIPVLESIALGTPVAFAGTQPAAEIMEGDGAQRMLINDRSAEEIAQALLDLAATDSLNLLRESLDASRIPLWRDFARGVARAIVQAGP